MIITDHAARRYVKRLACDLTVAQARADLKRTSLSAALLPERTRNGQQLWRTTDCRDAVLVVKHDPMYGLVVVTVLGPDRIADDEATDSVLAAFERVESAREAPQPVGETWRARCDRLNREADAAEKRHAERVQQRIAQERLEATAKGRRAAKQRQQVMEAADRKARRMADHDARTARSMAEARERKAARAAAHAVRMAEAREDRAVYMAQWSGVLP